MCKIIAFAQFMTLFNTSTTYKLSFVKFVYFSGVTSWFLFNLFIFLELLQVLPGPQM